jgi:hypothetical protein
MHKNRILTGIAQKVQRQSGPVGRTPARILKWNRHDSGGHLCKFVQGEKKPRKRVCFSGFIANLS